MEMKLVITPADAKRKLHGKFVETIQDLGGELDATGEQAFEYAYGQTVGQPGTGVDQNWRRDHGFLYEVTGRVARRALRAARKEGRNQVTWKHVAQAANCLIPDVSYYCHKSAPEESRWATRGPYCDDFEDVPESPTS